MQRATIVLVIKEGRMLLIRKKRGLGAGNIVGPGGRLDPGETPKQCAARELEEEVGVKPIGLRYAGEHDYKFVDGLHLVVYVFVADDYEGDLIETDEAKPIWCDVDAIPYDQMWADDEIWFPLLLRGKKFSGRWKFDGKKIVEYALEEV